MTTNVRSLVALAAVLAATLPAIMLMVALPVYARWSGRHPILTMAFGLILAVLFGLIGGDMGLSNLFWHEDWRVQFEAGVSVGALILLLIFHGFLIDGDPEGLASHCARVVAVPRAVAAWASRRPRPGVPAPEGAAAQLRVVLEVLFLPVLLLPTVRLLDALGHDAMGGQPREAPHVWALPLGVATSLAAADLALRVFAVRRWRPWHGWAVALVPIVVLNGLYGTRAERLITAAMALCLLLAEVALAAFATHGRPLLRIGLLVGLLGIVALTNGDSYKLTYPGLEPYSVRPHPGLVPPHAARLEYSVESGLKVVRRGETWDATQRPAGMLRLKDLKALAERQEADDPHKPHDGSIPADMRTLLAEAETHLSAALARDPLDLPSRNARAYVRFRARDLEGMRADTEEAHRLGGATALSLFNLGLSYESSDPSKAAEEYRQALGVDPYFLRARTRRAYSLLSLGNRKEAEAELAEAARMIIRATSARAGIPGAGYKPYRVVESYPGAVANRRGLVAFERGHLAAASSAFSEAHEADPHRAGFLYNRGLVRALGGESEAASADLVAALRLNPTLAPAPSVETPSGLLDDALILRRWFLARGGSMPERKPRLVVVAVSGGGIVAAYWTALCLTAIEERFPQFPYHIRVVTGASGGMVGAGLYVATLGGNDVVRTPANRAAVRDAMARESLTPVVRRLALRDFPSIFCPFDQSSDRGRVLEWTWEENAPRGPAGRSALAARFRDLYEGEVQGWRPSLIVSPLLVEDGMQVVISNLDLGKMRGVNLQFFEMFPAARPRLKLSTALRMNAAFPYVTPATSLPTDPPRRAADAGYVDNYGVRLAAAWIDRHKEWLAEYTSGVALVQIRAYALGRPDLDADPACVHPSPSHAKAAADQPSAPPAHRSGPLGRLLVGLQWATTPLEGYSSARRTTMISLNHDMVDRLRAAFRASPHAKADPCFFKTFVLECSKEAPLSWSLTHPDLELLDQSLDSDSVREQIRQLVAFLTDSVPTTEVAGSPGVKSP